jgi:hypothetical protein
LTELTIILDMDNDEAKILLVEVNAAKQIWKYCIKSQLTVAPVC